MRAPADKVEEPGTVGNHPASKVTNWLCGNDPRWKCNTIVEIVSASFDSDVLGVGSSPYLGDDASTGVSVPSAATTSLTNRYLIRLCGIEIPSGSTIILRGLRQYAEIGADWQGPGSGDTPNVPVVAGSRYPLNLEVVSPFWKFTDGNISWHVKQHPNIFQLVSDANQPPGRSPGLRGLDSSLLYTPPFAPYVAANAGIPPGVDIDGSLGTIREIRFPWDEIDWSIETAISGPGLVVFYASVKQTDPLVRPQIPIITDVGALRPEDRFLLATRDPRIPLTEPGETAIYQRVAGAMTIELNPPTKGLHQW